MLHFTWHSFCHVIWHFIGYLARSGGVVSSGQASLPQLFGSGEAKGSLVTIDPHLANGKKGDFWHWVFRIKFLSWLHGFVGSPPEKQILIHLSQLGLWSMSWAPCLLSRWPLCFLGSLGSAQPRMANRSRYGLKG